jgi:hypothetical protein
VEGVDLLMKTPKPTYPATEIEDEEKDIVEKETLEVKPAKKTTQQDEI